MITAFDHNLQKGLLIASKQNSKMNALQKIEKFFVLHSEGETS